LEYVRGLGAIARVAEVDKILAERGSAERLELVPVAEIDEREAELRSQPGSEIEKAHQVVAWKLFVELSTRITTQSLYDADQQGRPHPAGLLSEALDSLHSAFTSCRDQLKESHATQPFLRQNGGLTLEGSVLRILNEGLRPFLARWHPRLEL